MGHMGVHGKKGGHISMLPILMTAPSSFLPGIVMLVPAAEEPASVHIPEVISVTLDVSSVLPPYKQTFFVLAGSTLEDVLKMAHDVGRFT